MKVFQPFRLDTVNHCLWHADKRVDLTPKAFDVLRYLVEHSDRLVTQDEILEALWPGTYVNPEVVKKYVLGIRKALGDHSQQPQFVATFPKRGYQFIAPVSEESPASYSRHSENTVKNIVGRHDASVQLDDFLDKAVGGQRQMVFITGEAGIGKTTLLDLFTQRASAIPNLRIARGQCVEGFGGKEAYYPVLEALGQWFRAEEGSPVIHTLAKQAPTWLIQFPSLVKPDQRNALQKEILGATRERMVREICEALETLTAQDTLVLILEDLHWVDPSTLDFISALARRRGSAKLLLLGTYRPADVIISQSPLKALKQDLVLHNQCREVILERLDETDIGKYVAIKFTEHGLPARFANLIYRHSGGNPLFMVTILQHMVKKGLLTQSEGHWTLAVRLEELEPSVPETLDQLIEGQFQQLSEPEQRILKVASVAGERFSVWCISTTIDLDSEQVENYCEGLAQRHQFLVGTGIYELPDGGFSAHYEFRHSLYRQVLYRRLSDAHRSKLHRACAVRLQELCDAGSRELASELASHLEAARDYEQAVPYLMIAAENAAGRFAYRDAIAILHHARELTPKIAPALRDELEVRVLESIGDANFALGALVQSAEAYATAAKRAQRAGLESAQLHVLISAMYPLGFIDPVRGISALEEAVQVSRSANDPALLASTQMQAAGCRLVFDAWSQPDADLWNSSYATLLRLNPSLFDTYQQIACAHVAILHGRYGDALGLCERSIAEASASRVGHVANFLAHFGAFSAKTISLLHMGQLGKVLQITQASRSSPDENLAFYWQLSFREAWLRSIAFDFEGARRICRETGQVGGDHPIAYGETIDRMATGYLALHAGKYSQAIEHFRLVYEPAIPTKFFLHWWYRLMARLEAINACLLSGNLPSARANAKDFFRSALSTADPYLQTLAWDLKARLAMAESDGHGARESIQQAFAIVEKFEILVPAWQVYATAWQFHLHLKEHQNAEANRERAASCILKIADSFTPDEPLRATFLAAPPVHRVLRGQPPKKSAGPAQRNNSVSAR
jgi:DNA-binding winged helix-turn-helix (wHTH) protein/tetratricopeptide (TPR) repeat protein